MSTNHTQHFDLCQWQATDKVLRTDFNEDNAKIDAALGMLTAEMPHFVFGTYDGDGAESRKITLGITPTALYLCSSSGLTYSGASYYYFGGLALRDAPLASNDVPILTIVPGGFMVYFRTSPNVRTNALKTSFHYIAMY